MRKTIYILLAVLGISLFAGCDSKDDKPSPLAGQLVGEWHLTSWTNEMPQAFDAFIAFESGNFTIYQRIETVKYQKYTGIYQLKGEVLSGKYSDNTPWGSSSYTVAIDADGNTLTLTSDSDIGDVCVYTRTPIPASVKDDAIAVQAMRSPSFRLL